MKKMAYLAIAGLLFVAVSCKKRQVEKNTDTGSIIGLWELRHVHGGFSASGDTDYPPGNGYRIQFTDSTYVRFVNSQPAYTGPYTRVQGSFTNGEVSNIPYKITYNNNSSYTELLNLTGGKLIIYAGIVSADGTVSEYARIQ